MTSHDAEISLAYYRGPLEVVLTALDRARLEGAVLKLDGDASRELIEFIDERARAHPALAEPNRKARGKRVGPIRISAGPFHLPIEGNNLKDLVLLTDRHAEEEVMMSLEVVDELGRLVYAQHIGNDEIWVSQRLPQESVQALRDALGAGSRPAAE